MSDNFKLLVAVDIGTTMITAVAVNKYADDGFVIKGVVDIPHNGLKKGEIINTEETSSAIKKVVSTLCFKLSIEVTEIYVTASSYNMRTVPNSCYRIIKEDSAITSFDVDQLLTDNYRIPLNIGEEILHVIPQDYYVDNVIVEGKPTGIEGTRLDGDFNVIVARTEMLKTIRKCTEKAGYSIASIIASPVASAYGTLSNDEMEKGVVVVDVGAGTTDIAVFTHGILRYLATIPLGGNIISSDIREGCSVLTKQAEALKVKFGVACKQFIDERKNHVISLPQMDGWEPKEITKKALASVIEARVDELIDYVMKHIEKSQTYHDIGAGIVLIGGGAKLTEISSFFKLKTGFDVKIGSFSSVFDFSNNVTKNPTIASLGLLRSRPVYAQPKAKVQTLFDVEKQELPKKPETKKTKQKKNVVKDKTQIFSGLFNSIFDTNDTEM